MVSSTHLAGYNFIEAAPSVDEYLSLRLESGLSPKTHDQAAAALPGSWYAIHLRHTDTNKAVAMGRIIGDGGWYFHVADMAVLPEHQRRGLGDFILQQLMNRIKAEAPPGAYVNLLADGPERRLYAKHGFEETAPKSVGMAMRFLVEHNGVSRSESKQ